MPKPTVKSNGVKDNTRLKAILEEKIAKYRETITLAGETAIKAKEVELLPLITAAQEKIVELETALEAEVESVTID